MAFNGAEILINSLVKAAGLDSDDVKKTAAELFALAKSAQPQIQQLINWNVAKINEFDVRLSDMENAVKQNQITLQAIAAHFGVAVESGVQSQALVFNENQTEGNQNG